MLFDELDLLTNATVVDDAIRFVSESEKSKDKDREQVKRRSVSTSSDSISNEHNKKTKEPDYDDESDKEGEDVLIFSRISAITVLIPEIPVLNGNEPSGWSVEWVYPLIECMYMRMAF